MPHCAGGSPFFRAPCKSRRRLLLDGNVYHGTPSLVSLVSLLLSLSSKTGHPFGSLLSSVSLLANDEEMKRTLYTVPRVWDLIIQGVRVR